MSRVYIKNLSDLSKLTESFQSCTGVFEEAKNALSLLGDVKNQYNPE